MVSSPLESTPSNSVDVAGISIATAMRSADDIRAGSIYDTDIGACVPVFVCPLAGDNHLVLFSRHWTGAIPSPVESGMYISYTIDSTPGWMIVNGPSGQRSPVEGSYDIPMQTPHDSATLTAATSRPPYSIYLLYTVTQGSSVSAVLQHVGYNPVMQTFAILSEEVIPDAHLAAPPVALVYQLSGVDNLILDAEVTAKIFSGQITDWDDPAIAALNPGMTMPSTAITVIHRKDGGSTTKKFQAYLDENSTWDRGTGESFAGVGDGYTGAMSVLAAVGEGSIAYVEKPLAEYSSLPSARFGVINVRFDRGVFLLNQYLVVMGASAAGRVCMARKPWGRIGILGTEWEYYTGTGWSQDITEIQQAVTTTGKLTSVGPISAFSFEQNRIRLAAVMASGNQRYAQVYSLTNSLEWNPAGSPLSLGSAGDGTYQNGTLQFHSQLRVVGDLVQTPDYSSAVPYSITKKVFGSNTSGLDVDWGVWQLSRLY